MMENTSKFLDQLVSKPVPTFIEGEPCNEECIWLSLQQAKRLAIMLDNKGINAKCTARIIPVPGTNDDVRTLRIGIKF